MASVKVILRTDKELKNNEFPIVIRIVKDRKNVTVHLKHSSKKVHWDFEENRPKKKHPNYSKLKNFLDKQIPKVEDLIIDFEREGTQR